MPILGRALLLAFALALLGAVAAGESRQWPADLSQPVGAAKPILEPFRGGHGPSICLALRPRGRVLPLCVAFEQVDDWPSRALSPTLRGSIAHLGEASANPWL